MKKDSRIDARGTHVVSDLLRAMARCIQFEFGSTLCV